MNRLFFLYAVAALTLAEGRAESQELDDPMQLLSKAFETRKGISKAHALIVSKMLQEEKGPSERRLTVWMDGRKLRIDRTWEFSRNVVREIVCRDCSKVGFTFHWRTDSDAKRTRLVPGFQKNALSEFRRLLFDVRLIGMVPTYLGQLHNFDLEAEFGRADRTAFAVESKVLDQDKCLVVSFNSPRGTKPRMSYWIVPAKGYAVRRVRCVDMFPEGEFVETIDSQLNQRQPTREWFPSACKYSRLSAGKQDGGETLTIDVMSLNESIGSEIFTVNGIGVPDGSRITSRDEKGQAYEVKDGELVPVTRKREEPDLPTPSASNSSTSPKFWLVTAMVGFLALAIVTAIVSIRARLARARAI